MDKQKKSTHKKKKKHIILFFILVFVVWIFVMGKYTSDKQHEEYLNSPEHQRLAALGQEAAQSLAKSRLLKAKVNALGTSYYDSVEKEVEEIQDLLDQAYEIASISPSNRTSEQNKRLEALITLINSHGIVELELDEEGYINIITDD